MWSFDVGDRLGCSHFFPNAFWERLPQLTNIFWKGFKPPTSRYVLLSHLYSQSPMCFNVGILVLSLPTFVRCWFLLKVFFVSGRFFHL